MQTGGIGEGSRGREAKIEMGALMREGTRSLRESRAKGHGGQSQERARLGVVGADGSGVTPCA